MSIAYDARDYSRNAYSAPTAVWSQPQDTKARSGLVWLMFSFRGRATRLQYWLGNLLAYMGFGLYLALTVPTLDIVQSPVFEFVYVVSTVAVMIWMILAVEIKRWHDRGKSTGWLAVGRIPLVGLLWKLIELGLLPGDEGENYYGPDPRAKASFADPLQTNFEPRREVAREPRRSLIQPRRVSTTTEPLSCFALSAASRPAASSAATAAQRWM